MIRDVRNIFLYFGSVSVQFFGRVWEDYSLVGKVDFCLTDNASKMRRAFDVIASFHDEETNLAIKCITACILYIKIILIWCFGLDLETMGLGLGLGLVAKGLDRGLECLGLGLALGLEGLSLESKSVWT